MIGGPHVRAVEPAPSRRCSRSRLSWPSASATSLEGVILRLFGGYGPRQNITWWGGPQSVFIGAALKGEPPGAPRHRPADAQLHLRVGHGGRASCARWTCPKRTARCSTSAPTARSRSKASRRMVWGLVRDDEPRLHKLVPLATFGKLRGRAAPDPGQPRAPPGVLGYTPSVTLEEGLPRTIALAARSRWRAPASCDPRRRCPPSTRRGNMAALLASIVERLEPLAQRHRIVVVDDRLHGWHRRIALCEGGVRGIARGSRAATIATRVRAPPSVPGSCIVLRTADPLDLVVTLEGDQTSDASRSCRALIHRVWEEGDQIALASCYLYGGGITGTEPAPRRAQPRRQRPHEEGPGPAAVWPR